jgi:hypothetical protein
MSNKYRILITLDEGRILDGNIIRYLKRQGVKIEENIHYKSFASDDVRYIILRLIDGNNGQEILDTCANQHALREQKLDVAKIDDDYQNSDFDDIL